MRVLFATTANAGHFRPLVPFAEACLAAGHDVLVAGKAGAAPAARRAGLSFRPIAEPNDEALARFRAGQAGLSATLAMGRALTDLYIGLYAGAALEDMLAVVEEWRPDVVVRESAEFSALIAAQRLGVPHARVGIGLFHAARDQDAGAGGSGARRACCHGRSQPRSGGPCRSVALSHRGPRVAGRHRCA